MTTPPRPLAVPRIARRHRIRQVLGAAALNLAAAAGLLCLLALAAAWLFDITVILFKTGSMEPTIPTGAAAIVRQIPAAEVDVGDIVTVDRPGTLPVTHRVIAVAPGDGDLRVITLQGDANPAPDPAPYTVQHVRLVLAWVPGVAPWIVAARQPLVMALVTVGVSVLVVFTLWPRSSTASPAELSSSPVVGDSHH